MITPAAAIVMTTAAATIAMTMRSAKDAPVNYDLAAARSRGRQRLVLKRC